MAVRERRRSINEQRQVTWKQMSDIIEGAAGEGRAQTPEEYARYTQLEADLDAFQAEDETLAAHEARQARLTTPQREVRLLPGGDRVVTSPQGRTVNGDEEVDAFRAYIRGGEQRMTPEQRQVLRQSATPIEQRALTVTTTAGGYLIPQGFYDVLFKSRLAYGGMRQARTKKITTETGNDLPIPGMDDTTNKGVLLGINTQISAQDVAFTQRTLKAYVMYSKNVLVPWQLLQDSAFDVEGEILAPAFGERIGRIENDYFTTGTGTAEPTGVVTAAGIAFTGAATAANGPTYAEMVHLYHSLDPAYRASAEFMCNDTTMYKMRLLVDANARPLWLPSQMGGLGEMVPMTIMGSPLIINQSMADPAANADVLLFGDFSQYLIRDVRGVTVIRMEERYADYLQTGFFAYARVDGLLVDAGTDPVVKYRCYSS